MWSRSDINRTNSEAVSNKKKLERAVRIGRLNGESLRCEWHNHDDYRHYLWYDIFSDDPKGIVTFCEKHDGYYGSPSEGYFECEGCNRLMIENYTWELYYVIHEGSQLCLPCYAQEVLNDEGHWIPLTDERIESLTFNDVRKAPHCIGVKMPVPKEIRFVNNVEFDSSTGHCISGGGIGELKETLRQLKDDGETQAILILDAAYQFAVSVGVYAPTLAYSTRR